MNLYWNPGLDLSLLSQKDGGLRFFTLSFSHLDLDLAPSSIRLG